MAVSDSDTTRIRQATAADAALIARQRRLMFAELGRDPAILEPSERQFVSWVEPKLISGEFQSWLVVDEREVVRAGVGLWLREWIINPNDTSGREAFITNVYTEPDYRRRGYARRLALHALDWCKQNRLTRVTLHPTDSSRALYQSLGFTLYEMFVLRLSL